jgi:hypothetical protein
MVPPVYTTPLNLIGLLPGVSNQLPRHSTTILVALGYTVLNCDKFMWTASVPVPVLSPPQVR